MNTVLTTGTPGICKNFVLSRCAPTSYWYSLWIRTIIIILYVTASIISLKLWEHAFCTLICSINPCPRINYARKNMMCSESKALAIRGILYSHLLEQFTEMLVLKTSVVCTVKQVYLNIQKFRWSEMLGNMKAFIHWWETVLNSCTVEEWNVLAFSMRRFMLVFN